MTPGSAGPRLVRAAVDPGLAAQALLGPVFYQQVMTSEPLDPRSVGDLIGMVLGPWA